MTPDPTPHSPFDPDAIIASIHAEPAIRHLAAISLPQRHAVGRLIDELRTLVFPGFFSSRLLTESNLATYVRQSTHQLSLDLHDQVRASLRYWSLLEEAGHPAPPGLHVAGTDCDAAARRCVDVFFSRLPSVRRLLALDVRAAYAGDPAALHSDEIIFCYPGIHAVMVHRLAHELYRLHVPLLPRMMSETAHAATGIDIHPGARIGESFFIDHGTGVVIGETTDIGSSCTIYQGVTLGARSFPRDDRGRVIRGAKRHPTLGDRVTVYAGATVLGGDTLIGDDCVIAGGVFVTRSVPAGHVVRANAPELILRAKSSPGDFGFFDGLGI